RDVALAGDDVGLSGQLWNPEAMNDVGAGELEADRLSDRHVDLVRCDGTGRIARVLDLPPPAVTDDFDRHCRAGRWSRCGVLRHDGEREREREYPRRDNHSTNNNPQQLVRRLIAKTGVATASRPTVVVTTPPPSGDHESFDRSHTSA